MYRDQGVDEHSIDALVGHAELDASKSAYAGVGVRKRHEILSKLRHPWLNISPKGVLILQLNFVPVRPIIKNGSACQDISAGR